MGIELGAAGGLDAVAARLIGAVLASVEDVELSEAAESDAAPATGPAVTPAAQQMVRQAIKSLAANVQVDSIEPAPMPGFYQVIAAGQMLYVSTDGKYAMHGDVIDLSRRQNLSDDAWARFRKAELAKVPASERIVFAPPNPKYTITVFTDIECGYCRKLHSQIGELNRQGIAVEYLAFPRMGLGSQDYKDMVSVWCAADRKQALTAAKSGKPVVSKTCASSPVNMEYDLGQRLGVNGTPAIFGPDGSQLGGYLPPDQLRAALDKRATAAAAGGSP